VQSFSALHDVQREGQAVQVEGVVGPKKPLGSQAVHVVSAGIAFVWQVVHPVITSEQIKHLPLKK
jgi:hypothetical protein